MTANTVESVRLLAIERVFRLLTLLLDETGESVENVVISVPDTNSWSGFLRFGITIGGSWMSFGSSLGPRRPFWNLMCSVGGVIK